MFGFDTYFKFGSLSFVPETKAIKNNDCQLVTKKWSLEFKNRHLAESMEILVAIGAVAVGSLVVSGSVVVVGNSIHWLEQQGFVMTVSPKNS